MVVKFGRTDRFWQSAGSGERVLKKQLYKKSNNPKHKSFWLGVCGSAGKTYWCAKEVKTDLDEGVKLAIVLASFSADVRGDHKDELLERGVSASEDWAGEGPEAWQGRFKGVQAIVITYAMMGKYHKELARLIKAFGNNVSVYYDEPHHLWDSDGDNDKLTWGDHAVSLFSNVVWQVMMTGTPFRSDSRQDMPFSETEYRLDSGKIVAADTPGAKKYVKLDYEYRFAFGVRDEICRAVEFHTVNGKIELQEIGSTAPPIVVNLDDSNLDDKEATAALHGFIHPDNDAVKEMIRQGDAKLTFCRSFIAQAAGSIWTTRIEHAKKLADWMEIEFGERPVVVTGEPGSDSKKKLKEFKSSNSRWLISVGMVTEGVNIPRLMVGVYATNILTLLRFLQINWRLTRRMGKDDRLAFCFVPNFPQIIEMARQFMAECAIGMELIKDREGGGGEGGQKPPTYACQDAQGSEGKTIFQPDQITTLSVPETRRDEAKVAVSVLSTHFGKPIADAEALKIWDDMQNQMANAKSGGIVQATPSRAPDPDKTLKGLKDEINTKAAEYGYKRAEFDLCMPGEPGAAINLKPGYNKAFYNALLHSEWMGVAGNHAQSDPLFGVEEAEKKLKDAKLKIAEVKKKLADRNKRK